MMVRDSSTSLEMTKSLRERWCSHCRFSFPTKGVDTPSSWAVEKKKKKTPAIKHGKLAFVQQWEKLFCSTGCVIESFAGRVHHKVCDRHLACGEKRSDPRQKSKRDKKATSEFDNCTDPAERVRWHAVATRREIENLLSAVTSKQQPNNKSEDAINVIRKSIRRVHDPSGWTMLSLHVKNFKLHGHLA